jgi:iron complex outermembrane receptor protein
VIVLSFVTLLAAAQPAALDSLRRAGPLDSVVLLPEVRVERERAREDARRRLPTAFVSDLPAGAAGRALETVADVLGGAAGVRIVQYGGLGAFSTVSLRGAPPSQVAVYLDGAPLTSAAGSVADLSDLPATAVDRIEVYRGLSPLALGAAAPGGAVNLVTLGAGERLDASLARGSFDTWEARATAGLKRARIEGVVHAGYQGSKGDFRYEDDNGTPYTAADDSTSRRLNNRFDAASVLASLRLEPGYGMSVLARESFFRKAQGVPGLGAVPARETRLEFARSLSQVEVATTPRRGLPGVRLRGSLDRERSRASDRAGELGLGRHDTDDGFAGEDLALALAWPRIFGTLSLDASGALRGERADLRDAADGYPDPPESRRASRGATLGLQFRPGGERLVVHAAHRWDRLEDRLRSSSLAGRLEASDVARELSTPQLGVWLAAAPGLELRANWTDAARAPDFMELFGNQGSVLGNPALAPERGETWDAGARLARTVAGVAGSLEWAHFESRVRDLILYVRNSQSTVRAQNVSRAAISGEELSLELRGPAGWSAAGVATLQRARDRGPVAAWAGKRLPQRPERQVGARLALERARCRVGAELQYIGENFLDRYNQRRVPGRTLVGASASLAPFANGLRLTLEGKNLTDRHAADVGGFPLPGRSVFVACAMRLGAPSAAHPGGN